MIAQLSTQRVVQTVEFTAGRGLIDANRIADDVKERWQNGEQPDVAAVLASHPKLRRYRTVVLDLAYQEYLYHLLAGKKVDAETFSRRFPSFQKSLCLYIALNDFVSLDPDNESLQGISSWPKPGTRFLQFDLIAEIGHGSFGRVFLATEPDLGGRQVVVKVAPQGNEEAEILAKLCHPNIVPIYSLQKDATGITAFCMPYLGRATLCDVLDYAFMDSQPPENASIILDAIVTANDDADVGDVRCPDAIVRNGSYVDGVVHLAAQLADALAHSHRRGICHRDLKPSNILMSPDGRPLLLDFNLSADERFLVEKIGGTVPYMAAEELAAVFKKPHGLGLRHCDPRSDLFSLGVIIYELLTGHLPFGPIPSKFSLEKLARCLYKRQKKGPHPLQELNRHVDSRLAQLVESCLAFEPERRPETAQGFATALRKELTLVRRSHRWIGNHRKLVSGLVAMLLAVSLFAGMFAATREPYDVRQLQHGVACIERGKYAEAVDYLNNSLLANPDSDEAMFARGRAYQHLGEFQAAYQDYHSAYKLTSRPIFNVCKGYCLSRMKSDKAAISHYLAALEDGYKPSALLYNNLGYHYLMLGQIDGAEKYLRQAIALNGNLQPPHYNMVMVFLRRAIQGQPIPDAAFVHVAKAIEIGPRTAGLYHGIADFYAAAANKNPVLMQTAIEYVGKAVELGTDPKSFVSNPSYSAIQKDPAFQDAIKKHAAKPNSLKVVQLLDPLTKL